MSDTDIVVINCKCGKSIKVKAEWAGRWIKCVSCEKVHLVPKQGPTPTTSQTPSPAARKQAAQVPSTRKQATQKKVPRQRKTTSWKDMSEEEIRARQRMGTKLILYFFAGSVLILLIMLIAVVIFRPSDDEFYRRVVEDGDASAVKGIGDQALLAKVVFETKDLQARRFAIEKLTDQDQLRNVAFNSDDPSIRILATARVTDQETLAWIAFDDKERDVRAAAVRYLTDQAALAKVARHDVDPMICEAASEKITDPDLLFTGGIWVKPEYTEVLSDQTLLARIAIEASDADVRMVATKNLTNQDLLAKIAINDDSEFTRSAAVANLNDQSLANMGMWVDPKHTDLVSDQTLLVKIAVDAKDENVRAKATEKVTDQKLLKRIAGNKGEYDYIRATAVTRLTDQNELAKIAANEDVTKVRRAAAEKLTDPNLLASMGMWVKPDLTQEVADQALLAKLSVNAKEQSVRAVAVSKLTEDAALLRKIGKEDDTIAALARLRLALLDPRVASRIGSVTIKATFKEIESKTKYALFGVGPGFSLTGEDCHILITDQNGQELSDTSHVTKFPTTVKNNTHYVSADPKIQPILSNILKHGTFKPAELSAIAADTTAVKELRDAAASGNSN